MGTVTANDRFVVNVSVGAALGQTFAPLPPRRAPPLLRGHSAGVFEFCSGLVNLVVGVRHHRGGGHRLALVGERFVGLVVEDIAQVGDHIAARRVAAGWAIPVTEKVTRRKRGGGRAGSF